MYKIATFLMTTVFSLVLANQATAACPGGNCYRNQSRSPQGPMYNQNYQYQQPRGYRQGAAYGYQEQPMYGQYSQQPMYGQQSMYGQQPMYGQSQGSFEYQEAPQSNVYGYQQYGTYENAPQGGYGFQQEQWQQNYGTNNQGYGFDRNANMRGSSYGTTNQSTNQPSVEDRTMGGSNQQPTSRVTPTTTPSTATNQNLNNRTR